MEAVIQNKIQKKKDTNFGANLGEIKSRETTEKVKKMIPGKSLEQIREEARRQLRQMGLFF